MELGESFTVTVGGRPAAKLVPAERNRWCRFDDIKEVFEGPAVLVATEPRTRAERLRRLAVVERSFHPLPVDAAVARSYGLVEIDAVHPGAG